MIHARTAGPARRRCAPRSCPRPGSWARVARASTARAQRVRPSSAPAIVHEAISLLGGSARRSPPDALGGAPSGARHRVSRVSSGSVRVGPGPSTPPRTAGPLAQLAQLTQLTQLTSGVLPADRGWPGCRDAPQAASKTLPRGQPRSPGVGASAMLAGGMHPPYPVCPRFGADRVRPSSRARFTAGRRWGHGGAASGARVGRTAWPRGPNPPQTQPFCRSERASLRHSLLK